MKSILFVNTSKEQCGVHQYGLNFFNLLRESSLFSCEYITPDSPSELAARLNFKRNIEKSEYDYIIFNYHQATTTKDYHPRIELHTGAKNICLFHDFYADIEDGIRKNMFYSSFMVGDSTIDHNKDMNIYGIGRILFEYDLSKEHQKTDVISAGSFGFSGGHKKYHQVVELMQESYDEAVININIPPNNSSHVETIEFLKNNPVVKRIHQAVKKPGIKVNVTHDFLSQEDTIRFLAKNTINIFSLDMPNTAGPGISSSLDAALSAKRPMAISNSFMFRHMLKYKLPITIEDNSVKDIIDRGFSIFDDVCHDWSRKNVLNRIESIILRS